MEQINKIELAGRVGTVRTNKVGEKNVCNFSVATTLLYKGQDGNATEEVTWHNCTLWSNKKYPNFDFMKVGLAVHLVGRNKMSKYTGSDGVERVSMDVIVNEFEVLPENEPMKAASMV